MIKLNIIAVGKLKEKYWSDAVGEYQKRISKYGTLKITELPESKDNGEEGGDLQRKGEAVGILKAVGNTYMVLLDLKGKMVTSMELAEEINKNLVLGRSEISFVIGGSRGVADEVKNRSDCMVAFGNITFPHQLMRVVLAEQLYRALTIINKTGYHK